MINEILIKKHFERKQAVIHTMDKNKWIDHKLIVNNFFEKTNFIIYKSKHLFIYIAIGIISLIVELSLRKYLLSISKIY